MSGVGESITQFIIEQQRAHNNSTGEMSGLLNDIASACKKSHISLIVVRLLVLAVRLILKMYKAKNKRGLISSPMR